MECGARSVKYKVWSVKCTVKCGLGIPRWVGDYTKKKRKKEI